VSLWDTGGGGGTRFRTSTFYRNADGAFLVYSLEDVYTFDNLQEWIDEASNHIVNIDSFQWALVGNKCDASCLESVGSDRVGSFCEKLQTDLSYKVSAKTGHNVMSAFDGLINAIHKRRHSYTPPRKCEIIQLDTGDTNDFVLVSSTVELPSNKRKPHCC